MKITKQQHAEVVLLKHWFRGEIARLRARQVDIIKKYEAIRRAHVEQRLRDVINKTYGE